MAANPEPQTRHITREDGVWGGRPIVRGTRVAVQTIVGYYKLGLSVEEILEGMPQLRAAQIYDALSYYHEHQDEIERDIAEDRSGRTLERHGFVVTTEGEIAPPKRDG
jgi:uncharacterized protein (DUF433 family)